CRKRHPSDSDSGTGTCADEVDGHHTRSSHELSHGSLNDCNEHILFRRESDQTRYVVINLEG
ncbi:MAG: hypothetical protein KDA66_10405, partial [Planctomycetaceae bacterium]|nr:hypothetical protein [Planctomycetaceae bacterium]